MNLFTNKNYLYQFKTGERVKINAICDSELVKLDSGFGVYSFECMDEENAYFTAQGNFNPELIEGQSYCLEGIITTYRGEEQLKVFAQSVIKPYNKKGIIAYLQILHGLKSKAELIYNAFGDKSISVLMNNPEEVSKLKGFGKKSVLKWSEELKGMHESQNLMVQLLGYGLNQKNAYALLKKYGHSIIEKLEINPYMLIGEVRGYSFNKCDEIALSQGIEANNINRIKAGLEYLMKQSTLEGHCYLPKEVLFEEAYKLLSFKLTYNQMSEIYNNSLSKYTFKDKEYNIDLDRMENCINNYQSSFKAVDKDNARYIIDEVKEECLLEGFSKLVENRTFIYENKNVYIKNIYYAETSFAKNVVALCNYTDDYSYDYVEKIVDQVCKEKGFILEQKQRQACIEFNLSKQGLYILNGSAGTGKTFVLNLIIEVYKRLNNNKIKLLGVAPTGKASKVATKSIGYECATIHRALGFNPMEGFERTADNPFEEELFVCDETSMLDIILADNFFDAISVGSKVILMGDVKQLPSVGCGNVLKDLIECGVVKVVTLDVVKRQDLLCELTENANNVINFKMIKSAEKTNDFFFINKSSMEDIKGYTLASINRLLKYPEYTFDEIQLLIAQRTGSVGSYMFNYIIQQEFNKENTLSNKKILKTKFEAKRNSKSPMEEFKLYLCVKDKVMHIKNNYNIELYNKIGDRYFIIPDKTGITNGESGIVEDIVKIGEKTRVIVKYDDYYAFYEEGIDELELAYAITIHKSQGSAWKAIVLVLPSQHTNMLSNNLIYTGISRARKFCVVIGDYKTVYTGIQNRTIINRYTTLKERIQAQAQLWLTQKCV